jgi:hypothetical protein
LPAATARHPDVGTGKLDVGVDAAGADRKSSSGVRAPHAITKTKNAYEEKRTHHRWPRLPDPVKSPDRASAALRSPIHVARPRAVESVRAEITRRRASFES